MKIYNELYVGLKPDSDGNMLGYATYVDTTAAYQKRKDSVDKWRDKKIEPLTVKNEPVSGFKIVGFDTRYSTSNKVIEILDPRGFKLQVYIPDFAKLLMEENIERGTFTGNFIWARNDKGNNYLVNSESSEYKQYKESLSAPKISKTIVYPEGTIFVGDKSNELHKYYGQYYISLFTDPNSLGWFTKQSNNSYWYQGHGAQPRVTLCAYGYKPYHVYKTSDYEGKYPTWYIRKNKIPSVQKVFGKEHLFDEQVDAILADTKQKYVFGCDVSYKNFYRVDFNQTFVPNFRTSGVYKTKEGLEQYVNKVKSDFDNKRYSDYISPGVINKFSDVVLDIV